MHYFGFDEIVSHVDAGHVTIDRKLIQKNGLTRRKIETVAKQALLELDAVAAVYAHSDLDARSNDSTFGQYRKLYANALYPGRSPHLFVQLKPFLYTGNTAGRTTHISAHSYDRHVPIFLMAEGIPGGLYNAPSGPEDMAPTLGKILGLQVPPEPDARVLDELGT